MKLNCLRKIISLILSLCILFSALAIDISAEILSDASSIEILAEEVVLNLEFAKTYYNAQGNGYEDVNDYRGKSLTLANEALSVYNATNSTSLTLADITVLKVSTADDVFLCGQFINFVKEKIPQIEELDMKEANVTTRNYSWSTSGYTDNALPDQYFGVYSGTSKLPNIKKIVLPDSLEIINGYVFKNLSNLEVIEFGNSLKSIGYEAFQNCSSLKTLNFPNSLHEFTANTKYYITGCSSLVEVSYHGSTEGTTDASDFYTKLYEFIKPTTVTNIDLSGSGIDTIMALNIANKTGLKILDISNCDNVEYDSANGILLYDRLVKLLGEGVSVNMPNNPNAEPIDTGTIIVSNNTVTLNLNFVKTYYNKQNTGYEDLTDFRGKSLALTKAAITSYNNLHSSELTIQDITTLKVTTSENVYLCGQFSNFIKDQLPQVEEVDMSGANTTTRSYNWETEYTDYALPDQYFGVYSGTSKLYNVKKIVLPSSLKTIKDYAFKNLTTLETIEFGDAVESIGLEAFKNCTNLKSLNFPESLYEFTGNTQNYIDGCSSLEEVSYNGINDKTNGTDFYSKLTTLIISAPVIKVDLSSSKIDSSNVLSIVNKRRMVYLNFLDCANIEYGSEVGIDLYTRFNNLKVSGIEVFFPDNSSFVKNDGEKICLSIHFGLTYFNKQGAGYSDLGDFRGVSLELANKAIEKYNNNNSNNLTLADINVIKITTSNNAYICGQFSNFIKEKLPQVEEIDMSGANITTRIYNWETNYTDNVLPNEFFGIYSGTSKLYNVKKIVLPSSLKTIKDYAFKNLTTLETIEFGDAVESIGLEAFRNCTNLKSLNFPESLYEFTGNTQNYIDGCSSLEEVSYHGAANSEEFYIKLTEIINSDTIRRIDLCGSGISVEYALMITNKSNLNHIDISECKEIEYLSDSGKELYSKLHYLISQDVSVIMDDNSATFESDGTLIIKYFTNLQSNNSDSPYNDSTDVRGKSIELANAAIMKYNTINSKSFTLKDIKVVVFETSDGVYLNSGCAEFIIDKLPAVTKIDLTKASVNNSTENNARTEFLSLSLMGIDVIFNNLLGDANADGQFDSRDLVHIKKFLAQIMNNTNNSDSVIDIDKDNTINSSDLSIIRGALLNSETLEQVVKRLENTYTLTISNDSIGEYSYMGWFLTKDIVETYQKMNSIQRNQFLDYVYNGEQVNYFGIILELERYYANSENGFDIETFKNEWFVGQNGLIDDIANKGTDVFLNISRVPTWMRGESPYWLAEGYEQEFAQLVADITYEVKNQSTLNIKHISIGDEPDNGSWDSNVISHYDVVPLLKNCLEVYDLEDVEIIGPNTCLIAEKWFNTLKSDNSIWENITAVTGHDFGFGTVTKELMDSSRVADMPIYVTSMGILNEHTIASDFILVDDAGNERISDYYTSARNMSAFLNDINMGANATMVWSPLKCVENFIALDKTAPNFYHLYYNEDSKVFEDNLVTSANYDYYSQSLNTIKPGANIYQCFTDKEGTMGGSFEDYTMNATAGRNPDGTWGINIFNKTDSTIASPYKNEDYAPIPQEARTIIVELDIVGLYGSGEKEFKVYSTNIKGGASEEIGNIILVDGKGKIEVESFELISLRSVESVYISNEPNAIEEEIKDLTVALAGNDYIYINGSKVSLNSSLELKYYNDYNRCGIMFEAEDFAKLIGAEYKLETLGIAATISNDAGSLKFSRLTDKVTYSGGVSGTLTLPESLVYDNGKYYFVLNDANAEIISDVFGIDYKQYKSTGLIVIGNTNVVNLGRFSILFQ